jgi:NAD(P)-dependent dehydrogenase (short-subunit alcohol dehydrogenase family)
MADLMKISKALVTGGTSGIGLAISKELIARGVTVYSISRNPEEIEPREGLILLKMDLSNPDTILNFTASFIEKYGTPDLLVNNAGYGAFFEWLKFPSEEVEMQMNVLFISPVILCKSFSPLINKNGGVIVNISSLATLYPLPYMPIYNAGKSALSAFTQTMMLESNSNIRWIDYRLGDVNTKFNDSAPKQDLVEQNESMKNAWVQIEKQLKESPYPANIARGIVESIENNKSGIIYGGGFFQSRIAPFLRIFLHNKILIRVLKIRYGIR